MGFDGTGGVVQCKQFEEVGGEACGVHVGSRQVNLNELEKSRRFSVVRKHGRGGMEKLGSERTGRWYI